MPFVLPWPCGRPSASTTASCAEGLPPLAVGIGIHRGPGLAGLIGSRERMEYGFVGRTVNLAARVQGLTRTHRVDILVTEALRAELDTRFVLVPMPAESVKGIAEPVVTYAVGENCGAPRQRPADEQGDT